MVLNWQMFRLHVVPQLRDATVRSRALGDGNISPWCVPGRLSVAIFSLHASPKGPRTGKAPLPGNISPPCIQNELALAIFARHASEKPRKSPFGNAWRADLAREGPFSLHGPLESCMVRESCHPWVLRLSVLVFRGRGEGGTGGVCGSCADTPLCARRRHQANVSAWGLLRRPLRVAESACLVACVQPLLARGFITLSTLRPQLHRPVRTAAKLAAVCRLPPKTWRCDGVSLNCDCSAVLF